MPESCSLDVAGPLTSFGRAGIPVRFSFTECTKSVFLVWKGHLLRVGLRIPKSNHSGIEASNPLLLLECGKGIPRISVHPVGHDLTAQTEELINDRHYCSWVKRLEGPRSRCRHIQCLPRAFLVQSRQAVSQLCPHTAERGRGALWVLFYKRRPPPRCSETP